MTTEVAEELLKWDEVVYVGRYIGQQTIDLKVETVLKRNAEILKMQEALKSMDGVSEVVWTQIVKVIGRVLHTSRYHRPALIPQDAPLPCSSPEGCVSMRFSQPKDIDGPEPTIQSTPRLPRSAVSQLSWWQTSWVVPQSLIEPGSIGCKI